MKRKLLFVLMSLPFFSIAQTSDTLSRGIHFENSLSWSKVLEKAKAENKYIFVDCFTTWCGPCKLMEKNIYPSSDVGEFYNQNFISVKVQMDKTSNDGEQAKQWYSDAAKIATNYDVNAYPTFLFFSPKGKIVHRFAGAMNTKAFINLGKNAIDSTRQYYTFMAKYHPENLSTFQMKKMADSLIYIGPELAKRIATDYLERLDSSELYTKDNLSFLTRFAELDKAQQTASTYIGHLAPNDLDSSFNRDFVQSFIALVPAGKKLGERYIAQLSPEELKSDDIRNFIFTFIKQFSSEIAIKKLYQNVKVINDVVFDGYAESWIAGVISAKIVDPAIQRAIQNKEEPNWEYLSRQITLKYSKRYADQCISLGKYNWYSYKKDEKQARKWHSIYLMNYELNAFNLNNEAWAVFLSSNDASELREALLWSSRAVMLEPISNWIDTYANLLYKLGRSQQALFYETQASKLDPDDKNIQLALEKMKKGLPTWPEMK